MDINNYKFLGFILMFIVFKSAFDFDLTILGYIFVCVSMVLISYERID